MEQVKRTGSTAKRFATEHTTYMYIYINFFPDTITNTCFTGLLLHACHFDVTKISSASWIEHQETQFCLPVTEKSACGLQSFLSPIVIFVE